MWSTLRTLAAIAMLSLATAKPLSQSIAAVASSDAVPAAVPAAAGATTNTTVPEATTNATVPVTTVPVTTANTSTVAPVIANDEQPAADDQSSSSNAEQQTAEEGGEYAGVGSDEPAAEGNADSTADADSNDAVAAADPCKAACTPKIDVKASVMEAYKRKRAHVAVIGDWGSCGPAADREGQYSWSVDWGDDASQEQKMDRMGPYQAEHIYQKKGKYTIETTFCHHTDIDGCDDGCKTYEKKLNVKP